MARHALYFIVYSRNGTIPFVVLILVLLPVSVIVGIDIYACITEQAKVGDVTGVLHSDPGRCRAVPADFAAWDRALSTTSGSSEGFGAQEAARSRHQADHRGTLGIHPPRPGCVLVYPALWAHEKDRERHMEVFPDREPRARPGRKAKVRTAWNRRLRVCISYRISS